MSELKDNDNVYLLNDGNIVLKNLIFLKNDILFVICLLCIIW